MPKMPPRKAAAPPPPTQSMPPTKAGLPKKEAPTETSSAEDDDEFDTSSYLSTGDEAARKIKESAKPKVYNREFFITSKEMAASPDGQVTVRVHFAVNYASKGNRISVPRVTLKENGRFNSYTSPDNGDCALRKGGETPSCRPVYVIVDHRQFTRQDKSISTDDVKLWIPPPPTFGVVMTAMKDLAEALGMEVGPDDDLGAVIDITKYEAKITKIGSGRKTTWALSFVPKIKPMSTLGETNLKKFFGELGYRKTMNRVLAPDPRYLISKGGTYTKPQEAPSSPAAGDDDPPF